jgi:hypothetical protein
MYGRMFEIQSETESPLIPGMKRKQLGLRKRDKYDNRNKYSSALATSPPNSLA